MNKKTEEIEIRTLLKTLTTKEKIGQLMQLAPFFFIHDLEVEVAGPLRELNLDADKIYLSGSILGVGSPEEMIRVQKKYLERSRHKIPLLFMADVIHGYKTIFPVPIALGATFHPELAELTARISAREASTSGIHVTFSPMADLARDPRWGRVVEGFGEDPYLTGTMAASMVKGYQKGGINQDDALASCIKHFAGYGASEAGRDYNTVDLSRIALFSDYLEPYKRALDAGARLVMTSFNTLDRIPATINPFLLRTVLREKWNSGAVTISDYDSLGQVKAHGVAHDDREIAKKGLTAGLDIEMASSSYINHLEELIQTNEVDESLLDEAVLRVLQLKKDIGLFENPYKGANPNKHQSIVLSKEHLDLSYRVAKESAVLLENDGILPLSNDVSIALVGPYANNKSVIGPWSWHGKRDLHNSLYDVLKDRVSFTHTSADIEDYSKEDKAKLQTASIVVLALGEPDYFSGEAHSRSDISLPDHQDDFFQAIRSINPNTVVILFNGRPLLLNQVKESRALLECFFLGSMSSEVIKDILYGIVNPSGKLPISFPRAVGQIPLYYNHLNTGRPYHVENKSNEYVSKYMDVVNTPLYPFGYGLSYTQFFYDNLTISNEILCPDETLHVSVNLTNIGQVKGQEVVQLYLRDHVARVSRPIQELKRFQKIELQSNETKMIHFYLTISDLQYSMEDGEMVYDQGLFTVMVGSSSTDYLETTFTLKESHK
ncbi:MAG: glycoside hydrolase family 3 C-terminal domain-containing protein [Bacilli bacterium]|nr:glycoside hydrolase family 3 C-terminal domain-containing protein [Bacilli bacterium]MBN2876312.1 glycoside hydrolase family 3 C-terminal domain-containing protein [Bacilli bacterium]